MTGGFAVLSIYHSAYALVEASLWLIVLLLLIPCLVILIECISAVLPIQQKRSAKALSRPRIGVLVPAHNEAAGLELTLNSILPQLKAQDQLVVIADNCSDDTAEIARSVGAIAIERSDLSRRGKGYALDFGLKFLAANPPDVVIVIDADCIVGAGAIKKVACLAWDTTRPVQANYSLEQPANSTPKAAVSVLAFTVKNLVRPLGLTHLGLPCLLTGTGMAFPWVVFSKVSLASGEIVEDMKLSLDLTMDGYPPIFCPEAKVTGVLPQQAEATRSQRTRWEHGHLRTLLTQAPRLFQASFQQGRFDLCAIALDLCVPPLSLLVMLWTVVMISALLYCTLMAGTWALVTVAAIEGLLIVLSVVTAWAKFARESLPFTTLLSVPLYILWKVPLYLAFLTKPQTKWVRTARDLPTPVAPLGKLRP